MTDSIDDLRALAAVTPPSEAALRRIENALFSQTPTPVDAKRGDAGVVTVVGAGLGGLLTAISAAELGLPVRVLESRSRPGGRASSLQPPYVANWGPHALYADGALWLWLAERHLLPEVVEPALEAGVVFRRNGRAVDVPMAAFAAASQLANLQPPLDEAFRPWAAAHVGHGAADDLSSLAGVFSFHHDPGGLAAGFLVERLARVTAMPPAARFVVGGWQRLIDGLTDRAHELGVSVTAETTVTAIPDGPTVLAVPLARAAKLLRDPSLQWSQSSAVLLDVALQAHPEDPYAVWDLDEAGWAETYTHRDATLAPEGEHLVQAQMGLRPGESLDHGVTRVEALLDVGYPGWRSRVTWRRRARVAGETGAVDLPGTTWQDRPHPDRGGGVFVVGDSVAAPGLLSEVILGAVRKVVERLPEVVL